jgi:uncharacterized protein
MGTAAKGRFHFLSHPAQDSPLCYDYSRQAEVTKTTLLIPMSVLNDMRPFSRIIILSLVAIFAGSLLGSVCAERPFPKPSGPVNDFADVITHPYEKRIGNLAKELFDKTGVALVLVTMHDLGGADSTEYANRLYNAWGIGKTEEDRGVLILVSVREQKMRIRTGAGLKAVLSSRQLEEIQVRFMAPLLKQNDYDNGLLNGVVAIGKIISKEAGVTIAGDTAPKPAQESRSGSPIGLALLVLGAAILVFVVHNIIRRSKAKAGRMKTQE